MALERYGRVNNYFVEKKVNNSFIEPKTPSIKLDSDMIMIPLSDINPISKDFTEGYTLSDYRRNVTSVLLVPEVKVSIENLLFNNENLYDKLFKFRGGYLNDNINNNNEE